MPKKEEEQLCFVIAPIGEEGSDIRRRSDQVLKHIIAPAAEECGYKTIRADSISEPGMITSQVIQHLLDDALVIADLTGHNPNVFYELAVRHFIRKPVVQIIQIGEPIPFNVTQSRTIQVDHHDLDSVARCRDDLIKQIRSVEKGPGKVDNPISVAIDMETLRQKGVKFPPATKAERAVMETEGEREIETEEEEKGIWDFVVDSEKSMKDITECMERITKATQEIGKNTQQRTAEVQKIVKSGLPGTASQIHKITSAVAMDMIQHAKKLEEEQPKIHNAWESFDENTSGLVQITRIHTKEDKEAALKFRSSVDELRSGIRCALKGVQGYREAIANMRGISRDINRASKRTAHILDLLISDLEGADSYCTKVLTLLDEKIEKEG